MSFESELRVSSTPYETNDSSIRMTHQKESNTEIVQRSHWRIPEKMSHTLFKIPVMT